MLDITVSICYYIKAAPNKARYTAYKSLPKKLEKSFEKGLTKEKSCSIITKLSR